MTAYGRVMSSTMPLATPARARPLALRASPDACYLALCAALFGPLVAFYLLAPLGFEHAGRDLWHHLAVLRELMASPFSPSNPHLPTGEPSRYYTPTAVAAALIGRALGLSAFGTLGLVGAATCVGFCAAVRSFALRYYGHAWAPLALLLTLLFGWGIAGGHAGFHNYATFVSSAAYPSLQAVAIGVVLWAFVLSATDGVSAGAGLAVRLAGVVTLTFVLVLTHQLGAVVALGGAGSLALFSRRAGLHARALIVTALGVGTAATLAWPYFDPWQVVTSVSDERWRTGFPEMETVPFQVLLVMPAVIGLLALRTEDGWRFELILPILTFGAAWLVLALFHHPVAHRVVVGLVLYGQLALVWTLSRLWQAHHGRLRAAIALTVALIAVSGIKSAFDTRSAEVSTREAFGRLVAIGEDAAEAVPTGVVAFASEGIVYPYQSTGRRVVSIPRPEPAAPSLPARQAATDRFFDPETSDAERRALLAAWDAGAVVTSEADLDPATLEAILQLGVAVRLQRGVVVVKVTP